VTDTGADGIPPGTAPRVLLVGMMGAGKTTVGRAVATQTGWSYLDNDELVERAAGRPAPDVLAGADEPTLRRVEAAALDAALVAAPPVVASVAAGVVLDPDARRRMTEHAFVVYLRASLAALTARVGRGEGRAWVADDPAAALAHLYEGRESLYLEVADLVLDVEGCSPTELAARIIATVTSTRS
jgi:shikimate kinase